MQSPAQYVILKPKKEYSLEKRHPWVFSGAIQSRHGKPRSGDRVSVRTAEGEWCGWGHYTKGQTIAVRMLDFSSSIPTADFWTMRLKSALDWRENLNLIQGEATNCCRLVHGEGDGLPGLILDWYDGVLVMQLHTMGMLNERMEIVGALVELLGNRLVAIYDKSAKVLSRHHGIEHKDGVVWGALPELVEARENGNLYEVDVVEGQKTGFFLDQRDNRRLLSEHAMGKRVLNVFSYTGGFSVSALSAGAASVTSLDSSARALEVGERNVQRNGGGNRHDSIEADALEYFKSDLPDFDVIVLDPPAFAKSAHAKQSAIQAYQRLNASALSRMRKGTLLFTFSCSQAVDEEHFKRAVLGAALRSNKEVQILKRLQQPSDHPIAGGHPEGNYLKGLLLRVL